MQLTALILLACQSAFAVPLGGAVTGAAPAIHERQSTRWVDTCSNSPAPQDFKAFDVGGCQAQLTFLDHRDHIAIQASFEAVYADGSRVTYAPTTDTSRLALSHPFYRQSQGLNWVSSSAASKAYTAVHEFPNVCRNGASPVAWFFKFTPSNDLCQPKGYVFTSPRVTVARGTRPAIPAASGRRLNDDGDFEISWSAVAGANAYTVILKYPNSRDEAGNPYNRVIGSRLTGSTLRATYRAAGSTKWAGRDRQVAVNVVNSQGVWNFTPNTPTTTVKW